MEAGRQAQGIGAPAFARNAENLHALNDRVNGQIQQWAKGRLQRDAVLQLGNPSEILRLFNVPDLPIRMLPGILTKGRREHGLNAANMRDLALNVQTPIAVFKSTRGAGHIVLVTEARNAEGNVTVAVHLEVTHDYIRLNDIRTIYARSDQGGRLWVEQGALLGYEKRKGRDWLADSGANNTLQPQAKATLDAAIVYDPDPIRNSTAFSRQPQTDSVAFRQWFGKSKVVDGNGRPMVVYHGTAWNFGRFGDDVDVELFQGLTGADGTFFFTDDGTLASDYASEQNIGGEGANVMPVYLSLQNPLVVDAKGLTGRKATLAFISKQLARISHTRPDQ